MEEQSDTPRTNASIHVMKFVGCPDFEYVDVIVARDLERELATATRERDEAISEIGEQARLLGMSWSCGAALLAKVDAITRERDEARAALRMIADGDLYNADGMRTIACKALAATEAKP